MNAGVEKIHSNVVEKTAIENFYNARSGEFESFSFDFNGTNEFESERLLNANLKIKAQSITALDALRKSKNSKGTEYKYRFSDLFIPDIVQKDNKGRRAKRRADYIKYELKNFEARVCVEYTADRSSPVF